MSWSYSSANLSSTSGATANLTAVRLMVGDTDTNNQQIQNEEINWLLSLNTVITFAAADACDILAAKYAFQCNSENSELRVSAAARHKQFQALADRLRKMGPGAGPGGEGAGTVLGEMYVGGAVSADVETLADNDSYISPPFAVGMDDLVHSDAKVQRTGFGDADTDD